MSELGPHNGRTFIEAGEILLLGAIIRATVVEAVRGPHGYTAGTRAYEEHKNTARAWFFSPTFAHLCELCKSDPDPIRRSMLRTIALNRALRPLPRQIDYTL